MLGVPRGRADRVRRADAEQMVILPASYDVVWSVEIHRASIRQAGVFPPRGWLAPSRGADGDLRQSLTQPPHSRRGQQIRNVCEGFLCPSLGTMSEYAGWMRDAGLVQVQCDDWTDRVLQTWEICLSRVRRRGSACSARRGFAGRIPVCFIDRFETILRAYQTRAMQYGAFVFEAPEK